MQLADYSRFVFALAFVVALIWFAAWLAKRFGLDKKMRGITGGTGRMQVREVLYLDAKRKMLLVQVDAREYILCVTPEGVQKIDIL